MEGRHRTRRARSPTAPQFRLGLREDERYPGCMRASAVLLALALCGCSMEAPAARDHVDALFSALDSTPVGTWTLRAWGNASFEDHARLVYHAKMEKVLLVSSRPNRGVFAWNGSDWSRLSDASGTLFMQGATYDELRARVVLFGGLAADHVGADSSRSTWIWEGGAWKEQLLSGPLGGGGANLVYDAARDRVVLTGGASHTNGTVRGDTWLFDGSAWTKAAVAESPGSQYAGAAFDRARGLIVLVRPADQKTSETWEWDGTVWSRPVTTTPLPYEYSYSLAYDETGKRVVSMVGGALWAWSGSAWSRVDAGDGREPERQRATIAYDAARGRLVAQNATSSTWEWDGVSWLELPPKRPQPRKEAAHAYDSARKRVIYFGSVTEADDATWEWDGESWLRGPPASSATPTGLAMAYDSKRSRAVVVVDNETLEYDGTAWIEVGAAPGSMPLLAFDAARGLTVGLIGSATWTWDGATWRQIAVAGPTSARDSALAYDAQRARIVRFGGYRDGTGSSQIDETWEWDGASWSLVSPLARPSARGGHALAYDSRRGRIVLYGGYRHNEVWEYDGTTWVQRLTPTAPPGSFSNGLVFDEQRNRMLFYASEGTLWEYQPVGDACSANEQCPSGSCVSGVCCDRACTSSCEVCSSAQGARQNGVCELLPDAGPRCMSSEVVDGGSADGASTSAGKGAGGCSLQRRTAPGSDDRTWFGLVLAALALRRGRTKRA